MEPRLTFCFFFLLAVTWTRVAGQDIPEIRKLHIRSDIGFRFATTKVQSQLANAGDEAAEVVFRVTLPKTAFMTNFSMEIDGKTYYGNVKEKEEAKKEYDTARSQGRSAGHVAATKRDSNKFEVSVNVAAEKKVQFELIYQEVLQRRLGYYEHVINIDPGQVVPNFHVQVHINESRPIKDLFVPAIRKRNVNVILNKKPNLHATIEKIDANAVRVEYKPEKEVQQEFSEKGLAGQFIVQYDVERALDGGEILVVNGYFVHALAPEGLLPIPKNILFVLDISGSMMGDKMAQMKGAMLAILDDLRHEDNFNIMTFNSRIVFWKTSLMKVTDENISKGKEYIGRMRARGMTNINSALRRGISFLRSQPPDMTEQPSIIIFLTDGMPTVGETNIAKLQNNIRTDNDEEFAIFSLGFGNGVDINFLKQLSLQNGGVARKIYAASDAAIQLTTFYREVSIPLLSDVTIKYETRNGTLAQVTKHEYKMYFSGGEMIIAGKLSNAGEQRCSVRPCLQGTASLGKISICKPWPPYPTINETWPPGGVAPTSSPWVPETGLAAYVERMWAYLTIKQLLEQHLSATNSTLKKQLKAEALDLSLKFKFVTPLTSMVVTRPNNSSQVGVLRDSDKDDATDDVFRGLRRRYFMSSPPRGGGGFQSRPGGGFQSRPVTSYLSRGGVRLSAQPSYSHTVLTGSLRPQMSGQPIWYPNRRAKSRGFASVRHTRPTRQPRPAGGTSRSRPAGRTRRLRPAGRTRRPRPRATKQPRPKRTRRPRPRATKQPRPRHTRRPSPKHTRRPNPRHTRRPEPTRQPRPRPTRRPRVQTTPSPEAATTTAPFMPSIKIRLSSGFVCLAWPRMRYSAHNILSDQGAKIMVSHGRDTQVRSVLLQTSSGGGAHLITVTRLLIAGSHLQAWGSDYTGNNVTVTGNKATVDLLPGLSVAVYRFGGDHLVIDMGDMSGVSDQAEGLLKNAKSWSISQPNNVLNVSATRSFPTWPLSRGSATCHAVRDDVFLVTGTSKRA